MRSSTEHRARPPSRTSRRIACLLSFASMMLLVASCSYRDEVKLPLGPYEGLGHEAAEQACQLIADHGRIAVWIAETKRTKNEGVERMFAAFSDALAKHANVQLANVERQEVEGLGLSSGDFHELLEKSGRADAVVSFLGAPALAEAEIRNLPDARPKILAVDSSAPPGRIAALLERRVLHAAIVPRAGTPASEPTPRSPREWFDRHYEVRRP